MRYLLLLVLLSGCTAVDTVQGQIADRGAALSDEALQSAEWVYCKAVSVGAWQRKFGNDPAKATAWRTICSNVVEQAPMEVVK